MENKPKNREWVKNAAIVFLVILLILTFFSNTIMNITLPEVATQAVESGSIVAKVRGSGTVVANGFYEVKADQTREIRSVVVRAGQAVNTGDVLFTLGSGDSDELKAAQDELRSLEFSYQATALSNPVYSHSSTAAAKDAAEKKYKEAQSALDVIEKQKMNQFANELAADKQNAVLARIEYEGDPNDTSKQGAKKPYDEMLEKDKALEAAKSKVADAQSNLDFATTEVNSATTSEDHYKKTYEEAKKAYDDAVTAGAPQAEQDAKKNAMDAAKTDWDTAIKDLDRANLQLTIATQNKADAEKNESVAKGEVDKYTPEQRVVLEDNYNQAKKKYEAMMAKVDLGLAGYDEEYKKAVTLRDEAKEDYDRLAAELEELIASDNRSQAMTWNSLSEIATKMEDKKKLIEELSGGTENEILSNVNGVVQSISCTAGSKVPKGEVLCTIEVPDQGYSMSFTVTSDQARRLHTGDTATVSNYYWGREVKATLVSMKADPKNPQGSKILEFDLEGEVTAGAELTISVGQKSANYDLVVPNSSIRKDGNGTFVLAVEAKNSPLGNRYFAKRVNVEVLASDDVNSAVTGDLNAYSDYVITTGSTIVNNKDQVRMADS